jgi:hypothetical protein
MENTNCKKCQFEFTETFEILKNTGQLSYSDSQTLTCANGGDFTMCCIACAVAPVTVWAYPACVTFCYYAFC